MVKQFKLLLAELTGIPAHNHCLVYNHRILKNFHTLKHYGLFLF